MFSANVWQPWVLYKYEGRAQINTLDIVFKVEAFWDINTKDEFSNTRHGWQEAQHIMYKI